MTQPHIMCYLQSPTYFRQSFPFHAVLLLDLSWIQAAFVFVKECGACQTILQRRPFANNKVIKKRLFSDINLLILENIFKKTAASFTITRVDYLCKFPIRLKAFLSTADAFSAENLGLVCILNDQPNPAKPSMVEPVQVLQRRYWQNLRNIFLLQNLVIVPTFQDIKLLSGEEEDDRLLVKAKIGAINLLYK